MVKDDSEVMMKCCAVGYFKKKSYRTNLNNPRKRTSRTMIFISVLLLPRLS